jgi:hypothetical protein
MSEPTVQQQVTQTLAEAYNLLSGADITASGGELAKAGATMVSFHSVIQAMANGQLVVTEVEAQEEPSTLTEPGLARVRGDAAEEAADGSEDVG